MGLNFFLLGPPYIEWNDSVLEIPRRQVRALLYYVATYPSAIPQERLHYLFWENQSEITCRRNLSQLLSHARNILPDKEILISKNSLIMLDYDKIWCDVIEFKNLILTSKDNDQHAALQRAAALYRGPYLDGVQLPGGREFEYLVERERFNFERYYLNLLYKLVLVERRRKDFNAAIEYAYLYLAVDNLSEDIHRQIIILYGLTGRPERAIEQYKICEDVLEQELQTKVSNKTQVALQDALLGRHVETENVNREFPGNIRPVRNDPTFVNKDHLSRLDALVNAGDHGRWGIVLLRGEMGIGKSSLLEKYLERFRNETLILSKKCNPGSRSIRYWPIRQLCLAAGRSNHRALKNNPDIVDGITKRLLGLSNTHSPLDQENSSDILTQEKYFSTLLEMIYSLADAAEGLVLCIENLEWADKNSLDFILYLCHHLREKNILIFGSFCCEGNENISKFFHNVQVADDFLGVMHLEGIDLDTTLSIVKYWLGDFKESQMLAEKLHRISAGNPLFLTELLRWVEETDMSVSELVSNQSFPLPTSISKVVDFRLSSLNQSERMVLDSIATMGYSFEMDHILNQTGLPIQRILDALDELVNRHFLVTQSATYRFRSELIRQSVLEVMSPARRRFFEQDGLVNQ